jgi:hypothetical protein
MIQEENTPMRMVILDGQEPRTGVYGVRIVGSSLRHMLMHLMALRHGERRDAEDEAAALNERMEMASELLFSTTFE